ncbi:hypothetical protein QUF80_03445 [Desulfococcaceae bacterium HSG8]|nr:hypothetical protein [Desulfococcaceae bacterium HSG8]
MLVASRITHHVSRFTFHVSRIMYHIPKGAKMAKKEPTIRIKVNAERIILYLFIFCIATEIFLVLIDAFINYGKYTDINAIRRLCNIAREDSLASWFGTTQTFMAGLTLWLIVLILRNTPASGKKVLGWCVIAGFFTYMAVDDGAEIHERMGTAFDAIAESGDSSADSSSWIKDIADIFPSYSWQLLFLPFFGAMGLFLLIFLWHELSWKKTRILLILALSCFVLAVGLDFIEGLDKKHPMNIYTLIKKKYALRGYTVRHFSKSIEEFIEMLGTTFFWLAFITYAKNLTRNGLYFIFPKRH